jgi:ankyrin repeat protein
LKEHASYINMNFDVVDYLLQRGADPQIMNDLLWDFYSGCSNCPLENVEFLLKHGANPNYIRDKLTVLAKVLMYSDFRTDVANLLIKSGADLYHPSIFEPLVPEGNEIGSLRKKLPFLSQHNFNVKRAPTDRRALYQSIVDKALYRHFSYSNLSNEEIQALLQIGANPNYEQNGVPVLIKALETYISSKNSMPITFLLKAGANLNDTHVQQFIQRHRYPLSPLSSMLHYNKR